MTPPLRKERIVEHTLRMFVAQGIKSVRMDDIAQQLGVSKRTLYELFGDKEGLLYLAMTRYFEQNCERWAQLCVGSRNVLESLFRTLGEIMDSSEATTRMMDNLRKFYPAVHERLMREGTRKNRERLREMLDQGIAEGLFIRNFNIELAITVLYYTSSAIVTRKELAIPEGLTERDAFIQIISTFFRGIATAKGLELIDDYLRELTGRQPHA